MWRARPVNPARYARRREPRASAAFEWCQSERQREARQPRRSFFFSARPRPKLCGIDGLESPLDFPRLAAEAVNEARQQLSSLEQKSALELVEAFDGASNALCRVADCAELCRNVHPNSQFVQSADEAVNLIAGFMSEVNLDLGMYQTMQKAESSEAFASLPFEAKRVLAHMRESMEHEGIHLPDEQKAECIQLLESEQTLSFGIVQRQDNVQGSSSQLTGTWVPLDSVQEALGAQASRLPTRKERKIDEVMIPNDPGWTEQILRNSKCPKVRRKVYEASRDADLEGEEIMVELLRVRQRLAKLRGYQSWNEYAQRESLLQNPSCVDSFLSASWERLQPGFDRDLRRLATEKERRGLGQPVLDPWDLPMMLQICKRQEMSVQDAAISEYLTYGSLMKGVESILERLLGVSFLAEKPEPGEVWDASVQKYVLREGSRLLGTLYLDPFMRQGKAVQSAQFTLQGSKKMPDGEQTPSTCLVFNFPVGGHGLPVSYAVTFMHEIGHALHSLLSETDFQHLSGTRGAVDFVEFPSHLFEHFVLDANCLASYATHLRSNEAMPMALQQSYQKRSSEFAHIDAVQQLMYATVDQAFYSYFPEAGSQTEAVQDFLVDRLHRFDKDLDIPVSGSLSQLLGLSRTSKFDHLVHYGGSYYCYIFNRALSAHVWKHGFEANPFRGESGAKLRDFFRGGSVVQSLAEIQAMCPQAAGFSADDIPLDAFVAQLTPK